MSQKKLATEAAGKLEKSTKHGQAGADDNPIAKADSLEDAMLASLGLKVKLPWMANVSERATGRATGRHLMGDDPRLPAMPDAPTLKDFFKFRFGLNPGACAHLLQSAKLAKDKNESDNIVLACLLHDISVVSLIRADHGYWAGQMVAPYVDEEVSWAITYHQSLRYFASPEHNYEYPAFYKEIFGEDFVVPDYLVKAREAAKAHRWYESAMSVVVNDYYAFDPDVKVELDEFDDVIANAFRQPSEGLGFDDSPVAHMWRTVVWPNNFL